MRTKSSFYSYLFILLVIIPTIGYSQLEIVYNRGSEWGYHDNSYHYNLVHSDSILDCSCQGLFNMIELNDTTRFDHCIQTDSSCIKCELELEENYWHRKKLFGEWVKRYWKMSPYHFALAKNNLTIIKRFANLDYPLDQEMISRAWGSYRIGWPAMSLTEDSIVENYLQNQGVWTWEQKESAFIRLCSLTKASREDRAAVHKLIHLTDSVGERLLFYTDWHQPPSYITSIGSDTYKYGASEELSPQDILIHSLLTNNSIALGYFKRVYANSPYLSLRDDTKVYEQIIYATISSEFPTIELFEFAVDMGILSKSDLEAMSRPNYKREAFYPYCVRHEGWRQKRSFKLAVAYYSIYFNEEQIDGSAEKKMEKIRSKLLKRNELSYAIGLQSMDQP